MKSIQSFLTIILAVCLIGMAPNLADAGNKTITVNPVQLVPTTTEDNYRIYPSWVTSDDGTPVVFRAIIKFPNNVNKLKELTYYHDATSGTTTVIIYRSRMGNNVELIDAATSSDNSGTIIEVTENISGSPKVNKSWTYWVYVSCSSSSAQVHGIKIKVSTK